MWVRLGFFILVSVGLTGCGGGGSSGSSAQPSPSNPQVQVQENPQNASLSLDFPLDGSMSVSESISFSGKVSGLPSNTSAEIRINTGALTYTSPLTSGVWSVENVVLLQSLNESYQVDLVVGGVVSDSTTIEMGYDANRTPFGIGDALAVDDIGQIYLVDERNVFQVDVRTGQRSQILDVSAQVNQDVVDALWLADAEMLVILDADGGINAYQRSDHGWQWMSESADLSGSAIALTNDGQGVYVYQAEFNLIEQMNQNFAVVAEILLDDHIPSADWIAALHANELAIFGEDALVVLNLNTLSSTVLSLETLALGAIGGVTVDFSREQIYVRSASSNELWRLSLLRSAELTYSADLVDLGDFTAYAIEFYVEEDALVFSSANRISTLDAGTQVVGTLSEITWGGGEHWTAPASVTISEDSQFAYVSDLATDDIYQVNLATGFRTALNANGVPMQAVTGLAQNGNNLYSVDWVQKSVLMTEVDSGLTSDVTLNNSSQADLSEPIAIDLDPNRFRAFVLDRGLRAICEVDTANGDSSIIADSDDASALNLARALSFDQAGQTIYWSSWMDNGLHRLNLNTLQTELVSGLGEGVGTNFSKPGAIALAENASIAYVSDSLDGRIFSVDLNTGERSVVLDSPLLSRSDSIAYDEALGVLLVLDTNVGALYALNAESGNIVLVSM